MNFNTKDPEANKDNLYQFDLVKAASGHLSGAVLTLRSWPALKNGGRTLPIASPPSFVAEKRHQLKIRYSAYIDLMNSLMPLITQSLKWDIDHVSIGSNFNDGRDLNWWRDVSDICHSRVNSARLFGYRY